IDAATGQITPAGATPNTYTIKYTVPGAGGCGTFVTTATVTVTATPSATISYPAICSSDNPTAVTRTGTPGGTYTSTTGLTIDANTGTITPAGSTPGTYTVTYTVAASAPCPGFTTTTNVTITQAPTATIAYPKTVLCNVFNGPNNPNPPIFAIHTGVAGGTYSVTPSGLLFSANTGTISPSGALPGTYTIRYTIPAFGGCAVFSTTTTVTVNATPSASISYPSICSSDGPTAVALTGSGGGVYTSTAGLAIDANTGMITPANSTPGTYTVTYDIPASSPCPGFTTTTNVTITKAPAAAISYANPALCNVKDDPATPNPPVPVIFTGTAGGAFSITPSTGLKIDPVTGTLDPSSATPGNYTIRYTVAGTGSCASFSTTTAVTVSASPTATISYPALCSNNPPAAVTRTGNPGGVYTSTTGLSIDPATGTITPATSTPGTYKVVYTIAPNAPCPGFSTSVNVVITQAPAATIAYSPAALCNVTNTPATPNPPVAVTQTGTTGGSYTITPAAGLPINPTTGELTPSGAKAGSYTITYVAPGAGACANYTTTTNVVVSDAPQATISYKSPFCRAVTIAQPVTRTGNAGGTYSAVPAGLAINPATGDINPAASTPGTYTVSYIIAPSSPCPGYTATFSVQIDDSPVLTFAQPTQSICSGGTASFTPSSTVANTTYNWSLVGTLPAGVTGITSGTVSGPAAVINLTFTNTGTAGRTLTIQVTPVNPAQSPCPGAPYNLTLTVNPIPAALPPDTAHFCMGATPQALTATPAAGNTIRWYDQNGVLLSAAPVISTTAPAQYKYFATQYSGAGCESPRTQILAIVHPTAKIVGSTYKNPTACGLPSGAVILDVLDIAGNPIPKLTLLVHYMRFSTAFTIVDSTDANGKITIPLTAGTYSGFYVDVHGCMSQTLPSTFILQDPNPPAPPVAGYNPPICSETPLRLTGISPTSNVNGPIDYVWAGPAFGVKPDTTRNTVVIFPSAKTTDAGTYVVYAIQNNCISAPVSFQVVINQSPTKPIVTARNPLCVGDNLVLQAFSSIPTPGATLTYTWKGPGPGFPVNTPNATVNNVRIQDGGIYTITVSSPQTGCSVSVDTLIQIGDYPVVRFARDTFTLPTGYRLPLDPVIVNAAAPGVLPMKSYQWTPSADLACNDAICSLPVALIKNNTCYAVKATNIFGCSGSDTLCVKVFCQSSQIFIPNAFTPRGDIPENQRFTVRASGISSVKTFRVFNRWGRVVFERDNFPPNNPAFGWDGRVNGKLADPGVYIYTVEVMCENGVPYSYKGNVTLL
ncbi:MAG: gliding motility-associated C-terminal domain-containing protein, partial [Bacteroidetes bacterium]|nr:gliding motility-associated C-terminal domain-containing protein [Bacteroidota bacterium]